MDDDPGGRERCLTNHFQSATLTRFHMSLMICLSALKQTSRGCFIYCTTQLVSFSPLCNIYFKSVSHPAYQHLIYTKVFYAIESHQISHNLASDRTQIFHYNDKWGHNEYTRKTRPNRLGHRLDSALCHGGMQRHKVQTTGPLQG